MGTVTTPPCKTPVQKKGRDKNVGAIYRYIFKTTAIVLLFVMACFAAIASSAANGKASSDSSTDTKEIYEVKVIIENADEHSAPDAFFDLTDEQRTLIEQIVSAESRGEPFEGQMAVAQCILNACRINGIAPEEAIKKYKYTSARVEPTISVREAVAAVFDRGEIITEEPILYFYAPDIVASEFHESQTFVTEIAGHRFFKEDSAE